MARGKKHIHKYHRLQLQFDKLWVCARPDCTHYMPKHMEQMLIGKASICWSCGGDLILDAETMKLDRPICFACANPEITNDDELLKAIGDIDIK
jgi:hypothetical protein